MDKRTLVTLVTIVFFLIPFGHFMALSTVYSQEAESFLMEPVGEEAFQVLLEFFEYDRDIPLDARTVQEDDESNYTREKIVFRGLHDERVPGYLAIPKTGSPPYPCVLQLHGLSVSKSIWWEEDNDHNGLRVTQELLANGYAVLAIDAQYHGERMVNNDYENPMALLWNPATHNRFRGMLVQSTVEWRRALDYLESRPEIDSNRIGMIGYSMGGIMTFQLTAVDPRIKVSISCVGPPRIPNNLLDYFSAYNFAPAAEKSHFLVLMGRNDTLHTIGQAQKLHDLIGGKSKKLILYDSGHRLPVQYVNDALSWFKEHL